MTFSQLFELLDAYAERKRRELHEEGSIAAIAAHDPKQLKTLERPLQRHTAGEREPDPIGDYRRRRTR